MVSRWRFMRFSVPGVSLRYWSGMSYVVILGHAVHTTKEKAPKGPAWDEDSVYNGHLFILTVSVVFAPHRLGCGGPWPGEPYITAVWGAREGTHQPDHTATLEAYSRCHQLVLRMLEGPGCWWYVVSRRVPSNGTKEAAVRSTAMAQNVIQTHIHLLIETRMG